jgi:type IV secretory pathway VirB10-like protein
MALDRSPSRSSTLRALMAAAGLALALPVAAQWAWKDDSGRMVYSDRPPPAAIKPSQVVRQPARDTLAMPDAPDAAARPAAAPTKAPPTLAEREMEFRKRQTERAEAEKKAADEQAMAARKAQDCERARGYLKALEDGLRITRTNAQGEREYLDDAQRDGEMKRAREVIGQSCG